MKVRDLVSGDVVWVSPEQTLRAASEMMWEHKIGSVVVQRGGSLAGILTERDILKAMATAVDPDEAAVADLMTKEVFTVSSDWGVYEAAAEMSARKIRHIVLQDGDHVVGVLSMRDVLLAGQRLELSGGNWAILRDPLTFTVRERKLLHRVLRELRGQSDRAGIDDIFGLVVGSWSFQDAVPGETNSLETISKEDHESLRAVILAELPDLQRAVHPAPGWRKRVRQSNNKARNGRVASSSEREEVHEPTGA